METNSSVPPASPAPRHLPESLWRTHGDPRAARRSRIWVPIAATALLLFSVFNVYLNLNQEQLPAEVEGVVMFDTIPGGVVEGSVSYDRTPPVGGPHAELAHLCGLYRVPLVDEHAVKSMATGAVWIAYDPDLPAADIDALRNSASGNLDVLLAPYPGLEHPVVLSAWERQLAVESVNDPRIDFFIHVYQNSERAPDVDETCAIGVGPVTQ
jgi:hypothetical protein